MHVRLLDQGVIQPQSVTLTKIANAPDPQHQQHQCKLFTFSCGPHIKERATIKSGNIIRLKKLFLDLKNSDSDFLCMLGYRVIERDCKL